MRLALYQPDIPQNAGTMLRLAACLGVPVDVIGPTGFDMTDRSLRRAGLDYLAHVSIERHQSFEAFQAARLQRRTTARPESQQELPQELPQESRPESKPESRLVLLTTRGSIAHHVFRFRPDDTLLIGRESAGVPDDVHAAADARVRIPMRTGLRSLNVAVSAAIVLGEALRQTDLWPDDAR